MCGVDDVVEDGGVRDFVWVGGFVEFEGEES